jgi:ketosteroid isomerase-like protein
MAISRQTVRTRALATALALAPVLAPAGETSTAVRVPAGDTQVAVLAAQDERIAATLAADLAALGAMMTDDLSYTHSSGLTETKTEFLEGLRTGKYVYRAIEPQERRVRVHGEAAVVSGSCRIVIEPGGKRTEIRLHFTELYVRQGGRWRMALWHSTRLPEAPAK